jgi:hypothetical protein
MKQKKENQRRNQKKKGDKLYFGYKLYSIIYRNYELIRRFKTANVSLHDSKVELSEKIESNTEISDKDLNRIHAK